MSLPARVWGPVLRTEQLPGRVALPLAPGEIRELDGPAPVGHGPFGEGGHCADGCGVVDVHVRGQALPQALDEAVVLQVVHAPVARSRRTLRHLSANPSRQYGVRCDVVVEERSRTEGEKTKTI